ncbi:MAG: ABATE domain-containing protein [Anaerolineales bacterium]
MYDFDAGDLSLNFANTKDWHVSEKPVENLTGYSDLVTWGEQAGLISPEFAMQMKQLARDQPVDAKRSYDFAIQVREALYRIFSLRYAGKPIPEADLALLNSVVREALAHLELTPLEDGFRWDWSPEIDGANLILWPVARAAAELLTSDKATRVRVCEDDRGCGYLFIDQTKNHSRRWCSMESCGNRAKARRHYSRLQAR